MGDGESAIKYLQSPDPVSSLNAFNTQMVTQVASNALNTQLVTVDSQARVIRSVLVVALNLNPSYAR
ncbi:hypothetical protein N7471_002278 [Penicillium samsonianum]|uniref:uncharacterized protein n=1 Tax=Penicillium samsonianum TaxID=1882272 RepID=UPI002549528E|nr:uncharacterized protein N7471_002278 [Penicillium samsonianum]KAJ6142825.1 hypothetical protein N7471_002278 [Penicillium samsonianum]